MKNSIFGYEIKRRKKERSDTIVLHFEKRIPAMSYGAKEIAKMLRKYYKKYQVPINRDFDNIK